MWWGVAKTEGKATTSNSAFLRGSCCAPRRLKQGTGHTPPGMWLWEREWVYVMKREL